MIQYFYQSFNNQTCHSFHITRYLKACSLGDTEDWIGGDNDELAGFHWCGGSDRDTTGILMWNQAFKVKVFQLWFCSL